VLAVLAENEDAYLAKVLPCRVSIRIIVLSHKLSNIIVNTSFLGEKGLESVSKVFF
jgi:hypothetical protein